MGMCDLLEGSIQPPTPGGGDQEIVGSPEWRDLVPMTVTTVWTELRAAGVAADDEPYTELHEKYGCPDLGLPGRLVLDWSHQGEGPLFGTGVGKPVDQTPNTDSRQQYQSETGSDRSKPMFHNQPPAGSVVGTTTKSEERFSKGERRPPESYPDPRTLSSTVGSVRELAPAVPHVRLLTDRTHRLFPPYNQVQSRTCPSPLSRRYGAKTHSFFATFAYYLTAHCLSADWVKTRLESVWDHFSPITCLPEKTPQKARCGPRS